MSLGDDLVLLLAPGLGVEDPVALAKELFCCGMMGGHAGLQCM